MHINIVLKLIANCFSVHCFFLSQVENCDTNSPKDSEMVPIFCQTAPSKSIPDLSAASSPSKLHDTVACVSNKSASRITSIANNICEMVSAYFQQSY